MVCKKDRDLPLSKSRPEEKGCVTYESTRFRDRASSAGPPRKRQTSYVVAVHRAATSSGNGQSGRRVASINGPVRGVRFILRHDVCHYPAIVSSPRARREPATRASRARERHCTACCWRQMAQLRGGQAAYVHPGHSSGTGTDRRNPIRFGQYDPDLMVISVEPAPTGATSHRSTSVAKWGPVPASPAARRGTAPGHRAKGRGQLARAAQSSGHPRSG
jgi:hypothetical protein